MTKQKTRRGIAPGTNLPPTALDFSTPASSERLAIATIVVDDEIQQRANGVVQDLVAEYATDIVDWIDVAPVVVYSDGETHWLADGFHRIRAAAQAGLEDVPATVYEGDRRKAILYAVRANQQHGLRRTNADKRRAVETLLRDPEWSTDTDNRIAAMAAVSQPFVSKVRAQLITIINCEPETANEVVIEATPEPKPEPPKPEKRRGRDGKLYPATKPKPKPAEKPKTDAIPANQAPQLSALVMKVRIMSALDYMIADDPNSIRVLAEVETRCWGMIGKFSAQQKIPDHSKSRVAMRAAHAVTAALNGLIEVEADLLEGDARTLMANLGKAMDRLAARFPVAEGNADA